MEKSDILKYANKEVMFKGIRYIFGGYQLTFNSDSGYKICAILKDINVNSVTVANIERVTAVEDGDN